MKKIYLIGIVLLLLMSISVSAEIIASHTYYGAGSTYQSYDDNWAGQSFTTTRSLDNFKVTNVSMYLSKTGSPTGTYYIILTEESGNYPTSTDLCTGSGNIASLSSSYVLTNIALSNCPELISGNKYAIKVYYGTGSISSSLNIFQGSGSYTGGIDAESSNAGVSWTSTGIDFSFIVYGDIIDKNLKIYAYDSITDIALNNFSASITDGTYTENYDTTNGEIETGFYNISRINYNMISSWNLDKNDNITIEDQVSSNDGTLYGKTLNDGTITGATYGTHTGDMVKFGDYLDFDGDNDKVESTDYVTDGTITDKFTLAGWVNYNANIPNSYGVLFGQFGAVGAGSDMYGVSYSRSSATLSLRVDTTTKQEVSSIASTFNENHYVSVTYDGSEQCIYVIDLGTSYCESNTGNINNNSIPFVIGDRGYSPVVETNGTIDEVKLWNIALTEEQLQEEMTSVGVANPEGIIAYYNFDEGSGTTAYDKNYVSTGLNENVTAYNFDGVDDNIALSENIINLNELTHSIWFKTTVQNNDYITNWDTYRGFYSRFGSSTLRFTTNNETGDNIEVESTLTRGYYTDGNWHNIIGTVTENDKIKLYVDGNFDIEGDFYGGIEDLNNLNIGSRGSTQFFEGNIALPKIYDRALNETEILDLYTRELADERYPFQQQPVNVSITNAVGEQLRPYFDNETSTPIIDEINISLNPYAKINASDFYEGDKIDNFNLTYNSIVYPSDINGNVFLPLTTSGLLTLTKNNYFNNQTTLNPYSEYSASMIYYTRIYAKSIFTNDTITNFTVDYDGTEYESNGEYASIPLFATTKTVEIYNATNGTTNYIPSQINLTGSDYLQNYTFYLYDNPSALDIYIYDAGNGSLVNESVEVQVLGASITDSKTVTDGRAYFDMLSPDTYIVRFISPSYTTSDYNQIIEYNTYNNLSVYLFENATEEVVFTIKEQTGGTTVAGATVSISTVIDNVNELIGSKSSDIAGQVTFTYTPDKLYSFEISQLGYETKTFQLGPNINSEYVVWITPTTTYDLTTDYAGVSINYYINKHLASNNISILSGDFLDNTNNNFTLVVSSPDGLLQDYGYNLTYKTTSTIQTGTNTYGEDLSGQLNIVNAGITDSIKLTYWYNSSTYGYHEFKQTFFISNNDKTGLISNLKNERYGLGVFERVLIVIIIAGIFGGLIGLLNGQIAGGVAILFIFGYFLYSGFLEVYLVALPILLIIMYIIRSDS